LADKRGGELYFSTAHGPTFYFSVCLLIILNTVALILLTVMLQPIIQIHSNAFFSVLCGRNTSKTIFLKFYHINPDIFGK